MIFSEIYSAYYNAVAEILKIAVNRSVTDNDIRKIAERVAFSESAVSIESAIHNESWNLIDRNGRTPIKNEPSVPLSNLQKSWLKAISLDPRVKLFDCNFDWLDDVEPLFTSDDYFIFDKYSDGDNFEDETYIHNFKLILDAVKNQYPIMISIINKRGRKTNFCVLPQYLEYSEKDDKFRLIASGNRYADIINLGKIISCERFNGSFSARIPEKNRKCSVILLLKDERNALERVMLHFSHFEKQAERTENNCYRVTIVYDKADETELVIRILSFGPFVKVIEPENFVNLIKDRLNQQKSCGL